MPIRFVCQRCGQRLNVSSDKAGVRARCPKCTEPLTVPSESDDDSRRALSRDAPPDRAGDDPHAGTGSQDDDVEWVYAEESESPAKLSPRTVPTRRVLVPRVVLYTQGLLLAVVGMGGFLLGSMFSTGHSNVQPEIPTPRPCSVSGTVSYATRGGRERADDGAVILVLPTERQPAAMNKADIAGLRPGDPMPQDTSEGLRIIHSIGGAYTRTDTAGRYELRLPDVGSYYMLILSNGAPRDATEELDKIDVAQLGRYVRPPTELLNDRRYYWREYTFRGDRSLDFSF